MRIRETPTDEQISKLPKWAREYISTLAYAAHDAQNRLADLQGSQTETRLIWTASHGMDENPLYLGDGLYDTICYDVTRTELAERRKAEGLRNNDRIEITRGSTFYSNGRRERQDTTITLRGSDGRLAVYPKSANEFVVEYVDRWTDYQNTHEG